MKALTHMRGNAVAYLALFMALGSGSAWAATQLPAHSVGAKQLRGNAVTAAKVKDGTLSAADFAPGTLPASGGKGERGPAGPQGASGQPGAKGEAGEPGATGATGPQGSSGVTVSAEDWHLVGASGEPVFGQAGGASPFTWRNFGGSHSTAAFYKDPYGVVHLKGLLSCDGAGCQSSVTLFVLPDAYRPAQGNLFMAASSDGTAPLMPARINVDANGVVSRSAGVGGTNWLSLDGISFRAGA